MRESFPGYYHPTDEELSDLWSRGLIVLDANALLNLYRYSQPSQTNFLEVLKFFAQRLWLPFQAGMEFHRRRLDVIADQAAAYGKIISALEKAQRLVEDELNKHRRHTVLTSEDLLLEFSNAVEPIVERLRMASSDHRSRQPESTRKDAVLAEVTQLFEGRVGKPFTADELKAIYDEGRTRYELKQPPGFKDADKGEPDRYGDLVIWKEILRKAAEEGLPVIFVTDDRKEDWWRTSAGGTIGPRVELIEEFLTEVKQRTHFYTPEQFLRFAQIKAGAHASEESLEEVAAVSEHEGERRKRRELSALRSALELEIRSVEAERDHIRSSLDDGELEYEQEINGRASEYVTLREEVARMHRLLTDLELRLEEGDSDEDRERLIAEHTALTHYLSAAEARVRRAKAEVISMERRLVDRRWSADRSTVLNQLDGRLHALRDELIRAEIMAAELDDKR